VWLAPIGVAVGLLDAALASWRVPRAAIRILACVAAAWLVLAALPEETVSPRSRLLRVLAAAGVGVAAWSVLVRALSRGRGAAVFVAAAVTGAALAYHAAYVSSFGSMAFIAATLAAALAALLAAAWVFPGASRGAEAAPIVLVFVALLTVGPAYLNYGDVENFPFLHAALFAVALGTGGIPLPERWPRIARIAAHAALAGALCVVTIL
jgi:hypothetical protein